MRYNVGMTDRQAFIDAIIAQPDDDLPRLIFADWLDEQGEGERAEFIRVQCELATFDGKMPDYVDGLNKVQRYNAILCRERELLFRERSINQSGGDTDWFIQDVSIPGGLPTHAVRLANGNDVPVSIILKHSWIRGFVEQITCSWSDWQRHADAIRSATPLRKVRLTTWPGTISSESNLGRTVAVMELGKSYPSIEFELPQLRADVVPNDHWVDDLENAILHGDPSARRPMGILHAR